MTTLMEGDPVADAIREHVREGLDELSTAGHTPTVAAVLMSDDPADRRFVELKRRACDRHGIDVRTVAVDPGAPAADLYGAVERVSADPSVDAVFVQVPLPDHVDRFEVRRRIHPDKDLDCFHPSNLGRLVGGGVRLPPVTTLAVERLLAWYDVDVAGADVTVVGRGVIGTPLANRLLADRPGGNATVTVCHSKTTDLGDHTRNADVVVTAAGVPELVDASMLSDGVVVVDVSANRVDDEEGHRVVGDVDFEGATEKAAAITPVPGGVGPVTLAAFLRNVVEAARARAAGKTEDREG